MKAKKLVISSLFSAAMLNANAAVDANQIVNFSAGSPAKAAEVNQTIAELARAINANSALISDIQSGLEVSNSPSGRCYDYQSTSQKLRNIENTSGSRLISYVEMLDMDAKLSFDSANFTAQLVGEEHQAVMIAGSNNSAEIGTFKEFQDYDSYNKPVGTHIQNRQLQWSQTGDVVTLTITRSEGNESFDLRIAEDGTLMTGINRVNKTESTSSGNTEYKYIIENLVLREIDCSAP